MNIYGEPTGDTFDGTVEGDLTVTGDTSLQGDLDMNNNDILNAGTINYTTLNPPVSAGGGDVSSISTSSVGTSIARFSGATGKEIQAGYTSGQEPTISNSGQMNVKNNINGERNTSMAFIASTANSDAVFNSANFQMNRARGDLSALSGILDGDHLGKFRFDGHNGIEYLNAAQVRCTANGNFTATNRSTSIEFRNNLPDETTNGGTPRLTITGDGNTELWGGLTMGNSALNMNTNRITNLVDPTDAQDGATKQYVDDNKTDLTDLETKTQNISLATSPSETQFTSDIRVGTPPTPIDAYSPPPTNTSIKTTQGNVGFRFDPTSNIIIKTLKYSTNLLIAGETRLMTVWRDSDGANLGEHLFNETEPIVNGYYTFLVNIPLTSGTTYVISVFKDPVSGVLGQDTATNKTPSANITNIFGVSNTDGTSTRPSTDQLANQITVPQFDYIVDTGTSTLSDLYCKDIFTEGSIDMNDNKIINLLDPTAAQDAASKSYVDARGNSGLLFSSLTPINNLDVTGVSSIYHSSANAAPLEIQTLQGGFSGQVITVCNARDTSTALGNFLIRESFTTTQPNEKLILTQTGNDITLETGEMGFLTYSTVFGGFWFFTKTSNPSTVTNTTFWTINWGGGVGTQAKRYITFSDKANGPSSTSITNLSIYFNPAPCYLVGWSIIRNTESSQTIFAIEVEDGVGSDVYDATTLTTILTTEGQVKRGFLGTPLLIPDQRRIAVSIQSTLANPSNCSCSLFFSYESTPFPTPFGPSALVTGMPAVPSDQDRIQELEDRLDALTGVTP